MPFLRFLGRGLRSRGGDGWGWLSLGCCKFPVSLRDAIARCISRTSGVGRVGAGCSYHRARMHSHCVRNMSHVGGVSRNLTALRRFQDAITAVHMISPSGLWRDRTGMSHRRTSGSVSVVSSNIAGHCIVPQCDTRGGGTGTPEGHVACLQVCHPPGSVCAEGASWRVWSPLGVFSTVRSV